MRAGLAPSFAIEISKKLGRVSNGKSLSYTKESPTLRTNEQKIHKSIMFNGYDEPPNVLSIGECNDLYKEDDSIVLQRSNEYRIKLFLSGFN